jgi:hypothetical protein
VQVHIVDRAIEGWASDVLFVGGLETVTLNVSADSRLLRANALAHANGGCGPDCDPPLVRARASQARGNEESLLLDSVQNAC